MITRWYVINVVNGKFLAWDNSFQPFSGGQDFTQRDEALRRAKAIPVYAGKVHPMVFKLEESQP